MNLHTDLILASRSPRRRRLLEQLGVSFTVQPSSIEEVVPDDAAPPEVVETLALQKAQDVAPQYPSALTLGGDTVVVLDGQVLGQPEDEHGVRIMLQRLSEQTHAVYTGLALTHPQSDRCVTAHDVTEVRFAPLDDAEIEAYVATGSPMDKAGAYGIQDGYGALFVTGIDGDYYNVVGLPLHRFYQMLRQSFSDLFSL